MAIRLCYRQSEAPLMTSAPRSYALTALCSGRPPQGRPGKPADFGPSRNGIRLHFQQAFGIESLEARVVFAEKQPLFCFGQRTREFRCQPFFALARCAAPPCLFRYERTSGEEFQLTPLAVKVED